MELNGAVEEYRVGVGDLDAEHIRLRKLVIVGAILRIAWEE
jgi:hypothetical protein